MISHREDAFDEGNKFDGAALHGAHCADRDLDSGRRGFRSGVSVRGSRQLALGDVLVRRRSDLQRSPERIT